MYIFHILSNNNACVQHKSTGILWWNEPMPSPYDVRSEFFEFLYENSGVGELI